MKKPLTNSSYQKFLSDIEAICLEGKRALGQMYWKIGRRIVVQEQKGEEKAPYGKQLIICLSKDLTEKFGKGFSETNLEYMRRFYLENRISQPAGKLPMSLQIEALSIKDPKRRKFLLEKAMRKNLTRDQFRQLLHNEKISTEPELTNTTAQKEPVKLSVTRSHLYTYQILEPSYIHPEEEFCVVDLGFNFTIKAKIGESLKQGDIIESTKTKDKYSFKKSDAKSKELYTYKALVERVVDADTFWLNIDLGFNSWYREKVRLRGIDAPELSTKEGQEAKKFVESKLKEVDFVVIKTYNEPDKYERYLADIFYQVQETDPQKVLEEGIFLNQQLLSVKLAVQV
jgi:endonuclease YncB( thermonuclease family)